MRRGLRSSRMPIAVASAYIDVEFEETTAETDL